MPDALIYLFANPISGAGRARAIAERLDGLLRGAGYDLRLVFEPPDAVDPAEIAAMAGARCVVVVGGDGTVRAVVARLLGALRGHDLPPLLVVPTGTANLLGAHLGIRWTPDSLDALVLDAVRQRRVRTIDTASANGQPFLIVGGVGLDAAVVHELTRLRNGPIRGRLQYVLPAFKSLSQEPFKALTVIVDGQMLARRTRGMAFVGNIREYGTGFPVLPHARPDDGLLDVCVIPCQTFNQAIMTFLMAAAGEHLKLEQVRYAKGREIRIESDPAAPVQIDGEAAGFTPVDLRLLPLRMPFIVPGSSGQ